MQAYQIIQYRIKYYLNNDVWLLINTISHFGRLEFGQLQQEGGIPSQWLRSQLRSIQQYQGGPSSHLLRQRHTRKQQPG